MVHESFLEKVYPWSNAKYLNEKEVENNSPT